MIKKFFEKDSVLKITSFLIAILVWLYVIYIEDPKVNITIDDVPVKFNESELSEELALISYNVKSIDVEVEASRSEIINIRKNKNIEAYLDLSDISKSGTFDNIKINLSGVSKNIDIVDSSTETCTVQIDDVISKKIPIEIESSGKLAKGLVSSSEPSTAISSIILSGPKKYINTVKSANINIELDSISESTTVYSDIYLIDDKGKIIDKNHKAYGYIELSEDKVSAYVPVSETKTVDVVVPGIEKYKDYTISSSTVEIYGQIDKINKIYTEKISDVDKGKSVKLKLIIPNGVKVASDKTEITVSINE